MEQKENKQQQKLQNIEVWEDVVNIRDLIFSLIVCTITTMVGYLIAAHDPAPDFDTKNEKKRLRTLS